MISDNTLSTTTRTTVRTIDMTDGDIEEILKQHFNVSGDVSIDWNISYSGLNGVTIREIKEEAVE